MTRPADTLDPGAIARQLAIAEQLCARRGSRLTPLRRQVLEALLRHPGSLKAYELLALLQGSLPGAAPPTVYRALDFLTAQGLIHRLDAVNAWSACTDAGGEPHDLLLVCPRCGRVAELNDPALGQQLARCVARAGFALAGHEADLPELRALCGRCAAQPEA
ncbi:Fur family transcriptional regulator [Castellaniella sp.]|uniref:Fur family transcriptional regulator n=1 Tax=Castellaniella sp. TaxID=1955812 RepID=UPI0035629C0D